MGVNYSVSSSYGTLQSYEHKHQVTHTSNVAKTIAVSFFVGATLLATPFSTLSCDVKPASNYSSVACIDYVDIDGSKEVDYLNNSLFMDLLKIENLKKLDCMAEFQENWNGSGGRAFSGASLSVFRNIIEHVCKQPSIAPTGRDSLLLQYELDDHSMLAFEVCENRVEMVRVPKGDYTSAYCGIFTNDFIKQINSQVAQFYGIKQY